MQEYVMPLSGSPNPDLSCPIHDLPCCVDLLLQVDAVIATHMDEVCHSKLWRKDLKKYVCQNALGQKILIPDDGETISF